MSPPADLTLAALLVVVAVLVWPRLRHPGTGRRRPAGRTEPERRTGRGGWGPRRRRRRPGPEVGGVLALLDALGPALRAGLPPAEALRAVGSVSGVGVVSEDAGDVAGRGGPRPDEPATGLMADLVSAADRAEALAPVWKGWSTRLGSGDLALVASAWALCERLGAPLATTVTTVASVVRRRLEVRRRAAAALAGPRASMTILTALPVVGPLLALVMGLSPGDLYASPAGAAALGTGLVLLLVGRVWGSRLVDTIERPGRPSRSRAGTRWRRTGPAADGRGDPDG